MSYCKISQNVCIITNVFDFPHLVHDHHPPSLSPSLLYRVESLTATHVTVVVPGAEEEDDDIMSEGEGGGYKRTEVVAKVMSVDAIKCTTHQIQEARKHALQHFAGAKYEKAKAVRKGGLKPAEAREVANFLRDKTVVEQVRECEQ